jgi:site-specific DNA-methyltransferase (adenine-specific)
MPSSVKDRFTVDFEYLFFFSKNKKYYFEQQFENYSTQGRNKRAVWSITTKGFKEAHFAVFPEELIKTPIKAGCPKGGIILDPFMGSGTTGVVAIKQRKHFLGFEINPKYVKIANKRLENVQVSML